MSREPAQRTIAIFSASSPSLNRVTLPLVGPKRLVRRSISSMVTTSG